MVGLTGLTEGHWPYCVINTGLWCICLHVLRTGWQYRLMSSLKANVDLYEWYPFIISALVTIISTNNTIISKTLLWGARSTSGNVCTCIYAHTSVYCHNDPSASPHPWFPLSPHLSSLHPSHILLLHYIPSPSFSLCFFHFLSLSLSPSVTPFFPSCLTSSPWVY